MIMNTASSVDQNCTTVTKEFGKTKKTIKLGTFVKLSNKHKNSK